MEPAVIPKARWFTEAAPQACRLRGRICAARCPLVLCTGDRWDEYLHLKWPGAFQRALSRRPPAGAPSRSKRLSGPPTAGWGGCTTPALPWEDSGFLRPAHRGSRRFRTKPSGAEAGQPEGGPGRGQQAAVGRTVLSQLPGAGAGSARQAAPAPFFCIFPLPFSQEAALRLPTAFRKKLQTPARPLGPPEVSTCTPLLLVGRRPQCCFSHATLVPHRDAPGHGISTPCHLREEVCTGLPDPSLIRHEPG